MKTRCSEIWEGIVELAEGRANSTAEEHLKACPDCAEKLAAMKRVLRGMAQPMHAAPAEAVDRAKSIFPNRKPSRSATLVNSTLVGFGARSAATAENFQAMYDSGEIQARLLYRQESGKWEVTGRVSHGLWQAEAAGKKLKISDDGRFHFSVKSLSDSGVLLVGEEFDILIPSGEEARSGGA